MRKLKQQIVTSLVLLGLILGGFSVARAAPIFGSDVDQITPQEQGIKRLFDDLKGSGIAQEKNLTELVFKYINFALPYLALIAFVGLVYAGFLYVTNFGVEEQLTKAKRILVWSIVGIILVIASYTIVNFFTSELVTSLNQ
ncbi:hypothetical protein HZA43_05520 [Candidatus Peregrinibacteria bacterium]|nr:hypothetical protein [Candidatus Peregrinibacteria bacterium]